jgi:hypothetical protein
VPTLPAANQENEFATLFRGRQKLIAGLAAEIHKVPGRALIGRHHFQNLAAAHKRQRFIGAQDGQRTRQLPHIQPLIEFGVIHATTNPGNSVTVMFLNSAISSFPLNPNTEAPSADYTD